MKDPTLDEFVDSDNFLESDKFFEEYSSNDSSESGETEPTAMMPIFTATEDQEMRFRYALSQVSHLLVLDIEKST